MSRRTAPKHSKRAFPWGKVVPLVIAAVAVFALLFLSPRDDHIVDQGETWIEDLEGPRQSPVMLYFGRPDGLGLASEIRWTDIHTEQESLVEELVRSLIEGSRKGLVSSLPGETVLLEVFLDGLGGAYLNFSESLRSLHPQGDGMEWLTVRSIVASVTQNVPEIQRVWILVDGSQDEPLTRNVSLNRPYTWEDVKS